MHRNITPASSRQGIKCIVIEKVIARRWRTRNSRIFIEETHAMVSAVIRRSAMPTVHIQNQQVTAAELGVDKRFVIGTDRFGHFLCAPWTGLHALESMRPRRNKQLATRFIEIAQGDNREQPIHRRPDRTPTLVVVVRRNSRATRRSIVNNECGKDRVFLQ